MARAVVPLNFNAFLEKAKLKDDGSNYMDWVRNLRIILIAAQNNYVLEAPLSASNKLSGASGSTEAAGVTVLPFLRRGRLPDSGTTAGSGIESGAESGRLPCGACRCQNRRISGRGS